MAEYQGPRAQMKRLFSLYLAGRYCKGFALKVAISGRHLTLIFMNVMQ